MNININKNNKYCEHGIAIRKAKHIKQAREQEKWCLYVSISKYQLIFTPSWTALVCLLDNGIHGDWTLMYAMRHTSIVCFLLLQISWHGWLYWKHRLMPKARGGLTFRGPGSKTKSRPLPLRVGLPECWWSTDLCDHESNPFPAKADELCLSTDSRLHTKQNTLLMVSTVASFFCTFHHYATLLWLVFSDGLCIYPIPFPTYIWTRFYP